MEIVCGSKTSILLLSPKVGDKCLEEGFPWPWKFQKNTGTASCPTQAHFAVSASSTVPGQSLEPWSLPEPHRGTV